MHGPDRKPNPDDFELPYYKQVTVGGLAILFGMVLWFALTAEKPTPPVDPYPEQQTTQQQRIALTDGRSMTCLFP